MVAILWPAAVSWATATSWEKDGSFYFLTKNTRENFSAIGPGSNTFPSKYMNYDGIDFLIAANPQWQDYGRLNLEGNNLFILPIPSGTKIDEIHLLAGGSYGNTYKNDLLLSLYGENYYYATIQVLFAYQDGAYTALNVPIFWDWFHLAAGKEWFKESARIKSLGNNPARKNCNMYHISFVNPAPQVPVKNIIISDSWVQNFPFSDVFAVTIKSEDTFEAVPRTDKYTK